MNYRHHFHAGNFADVVKHVLLVRLIRSLQLKDKGLLLLDTHAGRGCYDLAAAAVGDTLARTPEWPDGIGRLWNDRTDLPAAVGEYVTLVREFDRQRGNLDSTPRFYPGSPWLTRMLARSQDRVVFCEKHPAEFAALSADAGRLPRVGDGPRLLVQETDGYAAIRALLPSPERRGLILIDPPYEAQDEFAQAAAAVADGLRRFSSGVFALWYPLTERARVQEFFNAILALQPPPTLVAEVGVAGDYAVQKMKGCGLIVINPPWRFDHDARTIVTFLASALRQGPGEGGQVAWLVPEK